MGYSTVKLFLEKKGLLPKAEKEIDYLVVSVNEEYKEKAFDVCSKLRKNNSVLIDLMGRSLAKQMKYANQVNAKHVVFVGEEEVKSGKVKIKNMKTGDETHKNIEEL